MVLVLPLEDSDRRLMGYHPRACYRWLIVSQHVDVLPQTEMQLVDLWLGVHAIGAWPAHLPM